jgi:hypothetical protein
MATATALSLALLPAAAFAAGGGAGGGGAGVGAGGAASGGGGMAPVGLGRLAAPARSTGAARSAVQVPPVQAMAAHSGLLCKPVGPLRIQPARQVLQGALNGPSNSSVGAGANTGNGTGFSGCSNTGSK